ncbi:hypothetical protein D9M68_621960 [compost metagenome]
MHQHFVHHHLEEQRSKQREYLEHEGGHQHFAKQLAVLDDGRDEPGEVEAGQFCRLGSLGAEQQQFAAPECGQGTELNDFRALLARILNQHLVLLDTSDNEVISVVGTRDGRQRCMGKALRLAAYRLGLEAQLARSQQQFGAAEALSLWSEFMGQLLGRRCNVMEACEHHQADQPCVDNDGQLTAGEIFGAGHGDPFQSSRLDCPSTAKDGCQAWRVRRTGWLSSASANNR